MLPSVSAYTRFWLGTANFAAASRNSVQFEAASNSKIASAVGRGESAVHASATAYPFSRSGASEPTSALAPTLESSAETSESSGPCRVDRTVISFEDCPAMRITSSRSTSGTCLPS